MFTNRAGMRAAVLALTLLAGGAARAARWYVDINAAGANNGTSWTDACVSLTNALTKAAASDEIWVAQGTYKPPADNATRTVSFAVTKANLTLLGGFNSGMTSASQRDPAAYPTILSGDIGTADLLTDNTFNVIYVTANGLTLDGFTISHGYASGSDPADRGGGLSVNASYSLGSLRNCRFLNNHARYGGAFIHDKATDVPLVVSNCLFVGNGADMVLGSSFGGAVYLRYCRNPRFTDCGFYANKGEGNGTAMMYTSYNLGGTGLFQRCVFAGNIGLPRDGKQDSYIMAPINQGDNTRADYLNCLFVGNCSWYGGVFMSTASANNFIGIRLLHCTAADNLGALGGVFHLNRTSGTVGNINIGVSNSILRSASWNHASGDNVYFYNSATCRVSYANIAGTGVAYGGYGAPLLADDGGNQLASDPRFATALWSGTWSAAAAVNTNACRVTLTDSSRSWAVNGLVGAFVRPVYANLDLAAGYSRALQFPIISNDATTITALYSPTFTNTTPLLLAGASYSINDYHLKSKAGRLAPSGWVSDVQHSPCIDAASPLDPFATEPSPNGGRANMGAFGNTAQASKSFDIPADLFVDASATGANTGANWADAFTNLAECLSLSVSGDRIWVAQGTYKPTAGSDRAASFTLKSYQSLYGGFVSGQTNVNDRDWAAHPTILSGDIGAAGVDADNSKRVVNAASGAVLDGFTVRDGYNDDAGGTGAGIYNPSTPLNAVRNCTLMNNYATWGSALNMDNAASVTTPLAVSNCTFVANRTLLGGALYVRFCKTLTISDCRFVANWAGANTAIAFTSDYNAGGYHATNRIERCTFVGNYHEVARGSAGNVVAISGSPDTHVFLENCLLVGNSSGYGTIYVQSSVGGPADVDVRLASSTVADNLGQNGGVFLLNYLGYSSLIRATVTNSILAGNASWYHNAGDVAYFWDSVTCTVAYAAIGGFGTPYYYNRTANLGALQDKGGNLTANPRLATGRYGGQWSAGGAYDVAACTLTLTDSGANWPVNGLVGLFVQPFGADGDIATHVARPLQYPVLSNSATQVTVWCGPSNNVIAAGATYRVNDYHLKSREGRWTPQGWVADESHSPCIDAGVPGDDWSKEPAPSGSRLNLGAYGNTPQASKSSAIRGSVILVH